MLKILISVIAVVLNYVAAQEGIDCLGKPFHCTDSTHFLICVEMRSGVSITVDSLAIQCPPPTECHNENIFECELKERWTATTPKATMANSPNTTISNGFTKQANEDVITINSKGLEIKNFTETTVIIDKEAMTAIKSTDLPTYTETFSTIESSNVQNVSLFEFANETSVTSKVVEKTKVNNTVEPTIKDIPQTTLLWTETIKNNTISTLNPIHSTEYVRTEYEQSAMTTSSHNDSLNNYDGIPIKPMSNKGTQNDSNDSITLASKLESSAGDKNIHNISISTIKPNVIETEESKLSTVNENLIPISTEFLFTATNQQIFKPTDKPTVTEIDGAITVTEISSASKAYIERNQSNQSTENPIVSEMEFAFSDDKNKSKISTLESSVSKGNIPLSTSTIKPNVTVNENFIPISTLNQQIVKPTVIEIDGEITSTKVYSLVTTKRVAAMENDQSNQPTESTTVNDIRSSVPSVDIDKKLMQESNATDNYVAVSTDNILITGNHQSIDFLTINPSLDYIKSVLTTSITTNYTLIPPENETSIVNKTDSNFSRPEYVINQERETGVLNATESYFPVSTQNNTDTTKNITTIGNQQKTYLTTDNVEVTSFVGIENNSPTITEKTRSVNETERSEQFSATKNVFPIAIETLAINLNNQSINKKTDKISGTQVESVMVYNTESNLSTPANIIKQERDTAELPSNLSTPEYDIKKEKKTAVLHVTESYYSVPKNNITAIESQHEKNLITGNVEVTPFVVLSTIENGAPTTTEHAITFVEAERFEQFSVTENYVPIAIETLAINLKNQSINETTDKISSNQVESIIVYNTESNLSTPEHIIKQERDTAVLSSNLSAPEYDIKKERNTAVLHVTESYYSVPKNNITTVESPQKKNLTTDNVQVTPFVVLSTIESSAPTTTENAITFVEAERSEQSPQTRIYVPITIETLAINLNNQSTNETKDKISGTQVESVNFHNTESNLSTPENIIKQERDTAVLHVTESYFPVSKHNTTIENQQKKNFTIDNAAVTPFVVLSTINTSTKTKNTAAFVKVNGSENYYATENYVQISIENYETINKTTNKISGPQDGSVMVSSTTENYSSVLTENTENIVYNPYNNVSTDNISMYEAEQIVVSSVTENVASVSSKNDSTYEYNVNEIEVQTNLYPLLSNENRVYQLDNNVSIKLANHTTEKSVGGYIKGNSVQNFIETTIPMDNNNGSKENINVNTVTNANDTLDQSTVMENLMASINPAFINASTEKYKSENYAPNNMEKGITLTHDNKLSNNVSSMKPSQNLIQPALISSTLKTNEYISDTKENTGSKSSSVNLIEPFVAASTIQHFEIYWTENKTEVANQITNIVPIDTLRKREPEKSEVLSVTVNYAYIPTQTNGINENIQINYSPTDKLRISEIELTTIASPTNAFTNDDFMSTEVAPNNDLITSQVVEIAPHIITEDHVPKSTSKEKNISTEVDAIVITPTTIVKPQNSIHQTFGYTTENSIPISADNTKTSSIKKSNVADVNQFVPVTAKFTHNTIDNVASYSNNISNNLFTLAPSQSSTNNAVVLITENSATTGNKKSNTMSMDELSVTQIEPSIASSEHQNYDKLTTENNVLNNAAIKMQSTHGPQYTVVLQAADVFHKSSGNTDSIGKQTSNYVSTDRNSVTEKIQSVSTIGSYVSYSPNNAGSILNQEGKAMVFGYPITENYVPYSIENTVSSGNQLLYLSATEKTILHENQTPVFITETYIPMPTETTKSFSTNPSIDSSVLKPNTVLVTNNLPSISTNILMENSVNNQYLESQFVSTHRPSAAIHVSSIIENDKTVIPFTKHAHVPTEKTVTNINQFSSIISPTVPSKIKKEAVEAKASKNNLRNLTESRIPTEYQRVNNATNVKLMINQTRLPSLMKTKHVPIFTEQKNTNSNKLSDNLTTIAAENNKFVVSPSTEYYDFQLKDNTSPTDKQFKIIKLEKSANFPDKKRYNHTSSINSSRDKIVSHRLSHNVLTTVAGTYQIEPATVFSKTKKYTHTPVEDQQTTTTKVSAMLGKDIVLTNTAEQTKVYTFATAESKYEFTTSSTGSDDIKSKHDLPSKDIKKITKLSNPITITYPPEMDSKRKVVVQSKKLGLEHTDSTTFINNFRNARVTTAIPKHELGKVSPICSKNSIWNELEKRCTDNNNTCVQFHCTKEGRFKHSCSLISYYICQMSKSGALVRYELKCLNGYQVNSTSIKCTLNQNSLNIHKNHSISKEREIIQKPRVTSQTITANINYPGHVLSPMDCNRKRKGRHPDPHNPKQFYICIGRPTPIIGFCPQNSFYNASRFKCTMNNTTCAQFRCTKEGRFKDSCSLDSYYICQKTKSGVMLKYKLRCQTGYHVNAISIKCSLNQNPIKKLQNASGSYVYSKGENIFVLKSNNQSSVKLIPNMTKEKRETTPDNINNSKVHTRQSHEDKDKIQPHLKGLNQARRKNIEHSESVESADEESIKRKKQIKREVRNKKRDSSEENTLIPKFINQPSDKLIPDKNILKVKFLYKTSRERTSNKRKDRKENKWQSQEHNDKIKPELKASNQLRRTIYEHSESVESADEEGIKRKKLIKREVRNKKSNSSEGIEEFICQKEGKYPYPNDCRKYYVCSYKKNKNKFMMRLKRCNRYEIFDLKIGSCKFSRYK